MQRKLSRKFKGVHLKEEEREREREREGGERGGS